MAGRASLAGESRSSEGFGMRLRLSGQALAGQRSAPVRAISITSDNHYYGEMQGSSPKAARGREPRLTALDRSETYPATPVPDLPQSLPKLVWLTPAFEGPARALAGRVPGLACAVDAQASEPADGTVQLALGPQGLGVRFGDHGQWVLSVPEAGLKEGGRGGPAGGRDLLLRAVGRPREGEHLVDATAGFGRDARALAEGGWVVEAWERSPAVAVVLAEALAQARADAPSSPPSALERIELRVGDVISRLGREGAGCGAAVVYLDPMHPPRRGSALVRKDLRALRHLVGPDDDAAELLPAALHAAGRRVVVKRPPHAAPLAGQAPTRVVAGRRARFDVYDVVRMAGSPPDAS